MNQDETVVVWDKNGVPDKIQGMTVLWRGYAPVDRSDVVSIPQLVETNADSLRSRYLQLIYELGERRSGGKRVVEHLEFSSVLSFWWMTRLTEKCNYAKSPQIDDAIKVLALVKWLERREINQLYLVSDSLVLAEVLGPWCVDCGVQFFWKPMVAKKANRSLAIFLPLKALVWLVRHLVSRWQLIGIGVREWRQSEAAISFVSYLFNLVPEAAEKGRYQSLYWANLPDKLQRDDQPTRWLHIWVKDKIVPTAISVKALLQNLNRGANGRQVHVMLDSFLGFRPVWNTLRDWLVVLWKSRELEQILSMPDGSDINLWPLFRRDWLVSIRGPEAISNLLMLNLFMEAFARLPLQHKGVYLQENQGWEFGFIAAWNNAGHRGLIGMPHSTVRFWDLRYFYDPRSYQETGNHDLPLPSRVAVNGPVAKNIFLQGGYPADQLVEVEALRYLYLADCCQGRQRKLSLSTEKRHLLVLGDYLPKNTRRQMELLEDAENQLFEWEILIKPHPNCPIKLSDYPGLLGVEARVTEQPIAELLPSNDVAYTSATTSAAVDAYSVGLSVLSVLDPETLNQSPVRGINGVKFVSTADELVVALRTERDSIDIMEFFYLDRNLPRWLSLFRVVSEQ